MLLCTGERCVNVDFNSLFPLNVTQKQQAYRTANKLKPYKTLKLHFTLEVGLKTGMENLSKYEQKIAEKEKWDILRQPVPVRLW